MSEHPTLIRPSNVMWEPLRPLKDHKRINGKKKRLCGPTIQRDLAEKLVIGESFNFLHRREVMRGC